MAINAVMEDTEEAIDMNKRAKKLGELAKKAVKEGNSSYNDLKSLIEDIEIHRISKSNGVIENSGNA
ncbi:hypothetical protein J1N35_037671 [Gossypium stocksii]|uniref:Uncharacterized protein n=1 Tax=Gossypium stocksii TaxID=47602 RepID=A0A9D3UKI4_9ROSI|nr:hypothetical protein J1N35_037671 [Gossypium stocksii]